MPSLFDPIKLGAITAQNRIFMAPMTRNRANGDGTHIELAQEYYRQRASAGLIISEASQIEDGGGGLNTPGIQTEAQTRAWAKVVDAVHEAGGKMFLQLWHVGRISTSAMTIDGKPPRAPSAIKANYETVTVDGRVGCEQPIEYTDAEIRDVIKNHHIAAQNAKDAGFDGVELHAANGYLIEQFLQDKTNQRTDDWGGSAEKRSRFMTEVLDGVCNVWGADRVAIRLSPLGKFNDMGDSDPLSTYGIAIEKLNTYGLAFLHMVEEFPGTETSDADWSVINKLKDIWKGVYVANGGFTKETGDAYVAAGKADAIAFGRPFISNPDLVSRFKTAAPLNELDGETIYGGDHRGYTDYPQMKQTLENANN